MNNNDCKFKEVSDIRYNSGTGKVSAEDSVKRAEKFLASHLDESEAYEVVGDMLMLANHHASALKPLLIAVKLDSKNVSAIYLLGFCYSVLGNWEKSFTYLDNANKIMPSHPEILRCLGYTMSEMGKKHKKKIIADEGIKMLFHAARLAPWDVLIKKDLASSLMVWKRFREGVNIAKEVLNEEPSDVEMLHVLDFYNKLPNSVK